MAFFYEEGEEKKRSGVFMRHVNIGTIAEDKDGNGSYAPSRIFIDPTLTQEGEAAEAKATGDAINALAEQTNQDLDELSEKTETAISDLQDATEEAINSLAAIGVIEDTKSGEVVSISDSAAYKMQGLRLYGKSRQATTTGAQLFDLDSEEITKGYTNSSAVFVSDDNWNMAKIPVTPGQQYTISGYGSQNNDGAVYVSQFDAEDTPRSENPLQAAASTTITAGDDTAYITVSVHNDYLSTAMVNAGETAKPWEPYTGGQPSPSPEYPQEIESAGDGVPTPDSPVKIESVGDGGSITATICGKQLLNFNFGNYYTDTDGTIVTGNSYKSFLLLLRENESIYISGDFTLLNSGALRVGTFDEIPELGTVGIRSNITQNRSITTDQDVYIVLSFIPVDSAVETLDQYFAKILNSFMINYGNSALSWEPYTAKTLTYPTPNGLPGIPVESGGNYTDADGQQWICDEVDFGRGKYVQRVEKEELTGTPNFNVTVNIDKERFWWDSCLTNTYKDASNLSLSNFATFQFWGTGTSNHPIFAVSGKGVYFKPTASTTAEEVNALFIQMIASENPPCIVGQLETPIETDLTPEQLAAYAALTTYKPNTTVTTDSSPAAGVSVDYVADPKAYIDNKFSALEALQAQVDALIGADSGT